MANPTPEIDPSMATKAGAYIVGTGRSDFPNQINNALVFPGMYKGLIEGNIREITTNMKLAAASALARSVKKPGRTRIVPGPFDTASVRAIARAVRAAA